MIYKIYDTENASPLFAGWEETLIWSCLDGLMGCIYGDHPLFPQSAVAVLGDFSFFAGKPSRELVFMDHHRTYSILVPQTEEWEALILDAFGDRAAVITRYATKKEPDVFDTEYLKRAASSLPAGYTLCRIDEPIYRMCLSQAWSRDLAAQFGTYEQYRRLGLGVAVRKGSSLLAGASSYSRYSKGIELEIDTREDCRRQGLAFACGAGLILECLRQGLYPSWDAHTEISLHLAEKLGYHFSHAYTAVEVWGPIPACG